MTAEFVAEEGPLKGLVLSLRDGDEWVIGRDPEQSSLVVEDSKVSRRHFICRKIPEGYLIENLSSTNPVKVNDRAALDPILLQDGDKVTVGGTLFHFFLEGEEKRVWVSDSETHQYDEIFSETIFQDDEESPTFHGASVDLTQTSRFIFKVISGPNTGAEFALDYDRDYVIGTDTVSCDIVFHDLSVSREHARLSVTHEGEMFIQDLGSRNGVIVDRMRIEGKRKLPPHSIVSLGTTNFLVIDREAPSITIATPMEPSSEEREEKREPEPIMAGERMEVAAASEAVIAQPRTSPLPLGTLLVAIIISGLIVLFGIATVSLFRSTEPVRVKVDYEQEIQEALKAFPAVKFTYNRETGKLFLVGHVATGVEKNELLYNLQGKSFIKGIEDNIVIDESVWQEINLLLSQNTEFQGISMHSPQPGRFVLTGYLKTNQQAALLTDYMNLHFSYLNLLENRIVVEEQVLEEVESELLQKGYNGVVVSFTNGDLGLTGYISSADQFELQEIVTRIGRIPGVRTVRNYVVALSPEQALVDLNERYPGRYQVTGYSKHGDININVVINGRILTRGETIDDMTITSIQPHTIFLEKDGLKYKIEYNK